MNRYYLTLRLHSDATFGRGEGVAGLVDVEIEHDERGCPFLGGRALKGLLRESWEDLRFALDGAAERWQATANWLFGTIGATNEGAAAMHVGSATLPPELIARLNLSRERTLEALTALRRQTAMSAATGAPDPGSLRTIRVLLRETPLLATLDFDTPPDQPALALLAACALGVRRGGALRNRGRGRLSLLLHGAMPVDYASAAFTQEQFAHFADEVRA